MLGKLSKLINFEIAKNVFSIFIVVLTLTTFSWFFIHLYRKVEGFVGEQPTSEKEKELRTLLEPITKRLCELQQGLIETLAKNNKTPPINENPTLAEGKRAAEDAKINESEKVSSNEPKLTQTDKNNAFNRLIAEAQHLLVKCPLPDDLTMLPASFADDLAATGVFLYNKFYYLNQRLQEAMQGGDTTGEDNSDSSDDPFAGLDSITRQQRQTIYQQLLQQMAANEQLNTVNLTPTEKDALLTQRIADVKSLLEKKNANGELYVEAYLAGAESNYAQLKKAKNGQVEYKGGETTAGESSTRISIA